MNLGGYHEAYNSLQAQCPVGRVHNRRKCLETYYSQCMHRTTAFKDRSCLDLTAKKPGSQLATLRLVLDPTSFVNSCYAWSSERIGQCEVGCLPLIMTSLEPGLLTWQECLILTDKMVDEGVGVGDKENNLIHSLFPYLREEIWSIYI